MRLQAEDPWSEPPLDEPARPDCETAYVIAVPSQPKAILVGRKPPLRNTMIDNRPHPLLRKQVLDQRAALIRWSDLDYAEFLETARRVLEDRVSDPRFEFVVYRLWRQDHGEPLPDLLTSRRSYLLGTSASSPSSRGTSRARPSGRRSPASSRRSSSGSGATLRLSAQRTRSR